MTKKNYYITTPIYYVNDSPHLGHAYTTIACDVIARFKRLDGYEVKFLTGTDEHGQKIDKAAKNKGITPQELTDDVSKRFKNLVNADEGNNLLNISNDDFIRTTESRHKLAAQALWNKLKDNGYIYLDKYSGWYSVRDEAYYQESELIDGKAPTGAPVEWIEEESYFFKLSAFQDKLLALYKNNPEFVYPESRLNEVISFVEGGLKDLSISRTNFDWGVDVPDYEGHVMYVWIDALTNYLTAIGFPDEDSAEYKKFWKNNDKKEITHVVGKDILRFHAVYWPAFLMAANIPLPDRIIAHGWWTIEGEKMSKSIGNVVAPKDMVEDYGLDQTRYFLLKAMPFGNDGDLAKERLVEVCNADLANNIGNLAQRALSMVYKNCDAKIPECSLEKLDLNIDDTIVEKYKTYLNSFEYNKAIECILSISSSANEYMDANAPWTLRKKEKFVEMGEVLYNILEAVRYIAILLQPFCPEASEKILDQLAVDKNKRDFEFLNSKNRLKSGTEIPKPEGAFPRLET